MRAMTAGAMIVVCGLATQPDGAAAMAWPPDDPGEPQATVAFTAAWAAQQRALHDIAELQAAAGSRGAIDARETTSETPRVIFRWTGLARRGSMRAFVYRDGSFGAIIRAADGDGDIIVNTFGAFVCPGCVPPVNACGGRPSWVPHDLHWDNFDCGHTLTGPQSLYSPGR